jgi:hypothetical protein
VSTFRPISEIKEPGTSTDGRVQKVTTKSIPPQFMELLYLPLILITCYSLLILTFALIASQTRIRYICCTELELDFWEIGLDDVVFPPTALCRKSACWHTCRAVCC